MTTLYASAGSGNCFKPWLVMTQLGLPFELRLIDILAAEHKSIAYLTVNPAAAVPYLVTENGRGIGESNAMLWYLAECSHLMPATAEDRAEALQWMFFEQTSLEPFISPARFFTTILPDARPARIANITAWREQARGALFRLDEHLSDRSFMLRAGYSIADISVFGYVHVLEEAGLSLVDWPSVARWIDQVTETPNFRSMDGLGQAVTQAAE